MVALVLMIISVPLASGATPTADYYVAPGGDDGDAGTIEQPFATVDRARQAVCTLIAQGLDHDVLVFVRGGTYRLEAPLVFGSEDSGTEDHAITYAAYPGETPVISGGRELTGWQDQGNNTWTTTIPKVASGEWWFRQLFMDGQRCLRARHPNTGQYLTLTTVSADVRDFTLSGALPVSDLAGDDAELVVVHNWAVTRGQIESSTSNTLRTTTPAGNIGHDHTMAAVGRRVFVEHALEFIDQTTEWYLDRDTGLLTYRAPGGSNPNEQTVIAPSLKHLLIMDGTATNPIRNLRFEGLVFAHTNWTLPEGGYDEVQAGHWSHQWGTATYILPLAVELSHARDCRFERCDGIMIGYRANRDTDLLLSGSYMLNKDWINPDDVPEDNVVTHNVVRECAAIAWGSVGIWEAFCRNTLIARNLVRDVPYTGISVGFNWGDYLTSHQDVTVEYNHVHHVMTILNDGGCIYTLGPQPGAELRNNLLHDVLPGRTDIQWQNNGVFYDKGSNHWLITQNVIYHTPPLGGWSGQGFGTGFRFNPAPNDDMTIAESTPENPAGNNSIGLEPGDPGYPMDRAALAGPEPATPAITIDADTEDPRYLVVRGTCEPWATVISATMGSDDVTSALGVSPNGVIVGSFVPGGTPRLNNVSLSVVVQNPEGKPSSPGLSNPVTIWVVDADRDGDVDQEDFGEFQRCLTGPGRVQMDPTCASARLDSDADVDRDDFTILLNCMSGANVEIDPACTLP
jgi:hypothetical protein